MGKALGEFAINKIDAALPQVNQRIHGVSLNKTPTPRFFSRGTFWLWQNVLAHGQNPSTA
jgi:hypothetical protein